MWVVEVEMSEKVMIAQIPAPTGVIGHNIGGSGNVVVNRDVSMSSLVQCIIAE